MPHKLEKFYSSFGGVDTRSNKLIADPKTFRKGSKNFRYNFQDEIQNANGWQHKTENTPVSFVDIFEYKYRDVNTGKSKSQVLAVGVDGNLYRKVQHTLKWIGTGAATSYSFFYDEVGDTFKMSVNGVGSVNISDSMTLNQLKTALNALTGITVDIVDNDGNSVTSSKLAYLLDVRIEDNFNLNSSWFWEVVPHPNIRSTTGTNGEFSTYQIVETPFQVTVKAQDPATYPEVAGSYEGISSVNLNNAIYITDGGFPHKYDGKTVYRAGLPKQVNTNYADFTSQFGETMTGMTYTAVTAASVSLTALTSGLYKYKARFAFTDFAGVTTYGHEVLIDSPISPGPLAANNVVKIDTKGIYYGQDFPTFCAKVNGEQYPPAGGAGMTLTVDSGHNILPGMVVCQPTFSGAASATRSTSRFNSYFLAKVTSVTETTITLQETACSDLGDLTYNSAFKDDQILQAYFVEDIKQNFRIPSGVNPPGSFIEVYRSKTDAPLGPYYLVGHLPTPHNQGDTSSIYDDRTNASLIDNFDDAEGGDELPRACKYLTKWQGSIVQAGYPADTSLKTERYPSVVNPGTASFACQDYYRAEAYYTEALLCDFQSIYWADPITPEGFPQDGLHEFSIDTEYNDAIKGIAPNKDALFAIKERSTGILTGDLGTNDIVLEVLEDDIGLASHKTLQQTKGALIWLDPIKGFYACVAGRLPQHIGYPICDYMQINAEKLDYSKAAAMNARAIGMYICVVGSTWFVYDYSETRVPGVNRNCWYIWERFSSKSALFTAESEILLLADKVWKMKVTNTRFDMTDHKDAIDMDARQAWWNGGLPTIDKVFERLWANSIQGGFTLSIDQYANYLDDRIASIDVGFKEAPKKTVKDYAKAAIPKLSAISFGLRNAEKNKLVRIQGFEIEYAPDFDASEPRR